MLNIWYYLLIALGINILMFIPAFIFKTDKLTDLSYSLTFIILSLISFFLVPFNIFKLLLLILILVWSLRLGIFLFVRIRNMKFDKRFDKMRNSFFKFLGFWILQAITVWIVLIPSIFFFNANTIKFCGLGLLIWLIGLIIESVADAQKYKFNQKNKNKFISSGLWKVSRHPNYFGEILCWIGIYLFIIKSISFPEKIIALAGPIFIILMLLFISGIPMLERAASKKWGKNKDYQEYKRRTSILIPWFTKK